MRKEYIVTLKDGQEYQVKATNDFHAALLSCMEISTGSHSQFFIPVADQPDPSMFLLFLMGLMIMWLILTLLRDRREGA